MNKDDKKTFIAFSIVLLILIINIAYAYFASSKNINNLNANIIMESTDNLPIFTSDVTGQLEINISDSDELTVSTTEPYATSSANIDVNLNSYKTSNETKETSCTYDIYLNYTDALPQRAYLENYEYELSIEGTRTTTDNGSGHTYIDKNLSQTDLSDFTEIATGKILLINNAEIYSKGTSKTVWTFTLKYYVLPVTQTEINFNGYLSVENVSCN